MLEIIGVSVKLSGREVLRDVTLTFPDNGLFFLLGPNGSGKSTLLKAIANLIPFSGDIKVDGRSVKEFKREELARVLGYVWQNPFHGFFERTVRREIEFILKNTGIGDGARVARIAEFFGITHLLDRSPFTLSGGEAKRVSISSVIVADQRIWLLDEPESEMDLRGLEKLVSLIVENAGRKLIIVATPNTAIAYKLRRVARGVVLLKEGRTSEILPPNVLEDSDLIESYGLVSLRWLNELA